MNERCAVGVIAVVFTSALLAPACSAVDGAAAIDDDGGLLADAAVSEDDGAASSDVASALDVPPAQDAARTDAAPRADADADADAAPPPPYARCVAGGPCQDLALDVSKLQDSVFVETRDIAVGACSVVEGTILASGQRRLLRFTTFVTNVGTADLFLGQPSTDPAAFQFAPCHGHYHFKDYADYALEHLDGTPAVQGHKVSFCVEDNVQGTGRNLKPRPPQALVDGSTPPDTWDEDTQTNCLHPGLHIGWSDAYYNTTEGNWLDITGLPPGDYKLKVTINPNHTIHELGYANNAAVIAVHVPDPSQDGGVCPATSDAIFRCTGNATQRTRCLQGTTTTETCPVGTSCVQPKEIAHSAFCE